MKRGRAVLDRSLRVTIAFGTNLSFLCHLDRSVPGFPTSPLSTTATYAALHERAARISPITPLSTGNPGERSGEICSSDFPERSGPGSGRIPQISPLRCAPVEMTKERWVRSKSSSSRGVSGQTKVPHSPDLLASERPAGDETGAGCFRSIAPSNRRFWNEPIFPLSSRPERSRISYLTALDNGHVCGSP